MLDPAILNPRSSASFIGLDLFVDEADKFLHQLQVIRAGDGMDLLNELPLPFDQADEVFNTGRGQRPSRALKGEQFVHLFFRELTCPIGLSLDPSHDFRLRSLLIKAAKVIVVIGGGRAGASCSLLLPPAPPPLPPPPPPHPRAGAARRV